jgi:hypothetical protein
MPNIVIMENVGGANEILPVLLRYLVAEKATNASRKI